METEALGDDKGVIRKIIVVSSTMLMLESDLGSGGRVQGKALDKIPAQDEGRKRRFAEWIGLPVAALTIEAFPWPWQTACCP
jgi:hypothetical protein